MLGAIVTIGAATFAVIAESADGSAVVPIVHAHYRQRVGEMALQSWIIGFRYPIAQCAAARIAREEMTETGGRLTAADLAVCQAVARRTAQDRRSIARYEGTEGWNAMARNEISAVR